MANILVVDDEEQIRRMLNRVLSRNEYTCTLAADAAAARKCLDEQTFDLVLCDVLMPGESGIDLARHMASEYRDTAVIILTGVDDPKTAEAAIEAGAYGYIIKPFNPNELIINIKNALRRQSLEIANRAYQQDLLRMAGEKTLALQKTLGNLQDTRSQLMQSEKMASIGQLAAGVAHEINNPVGFVKSNLGALNEYCKDLIRLLDRYQELETALENEKGLDEKSSVCSLLATLSRLKAEIDLDFILDDYQKIVVESLEGTERITKIIADLKDFVHLDKSEMEETDLNKGIESTLNIVWNELKYKADVTKDLGDMPLVMCHPQRLNQVFMNIMINAAQAIEKKGEIRITTRARDDNVEIKISDTGKGIAPDVLPKIFDPFFTTKAVGKGTGLGLNVSYNIIQKHKGSIRVESEVGKGTTFIIRLQVNPGEIE